jgi:GNAT superfamily N-acetyltransferase
MADNIDRKAFESMQYATTDKTAVDLMGNKAEVTKEDVHNMLMVAGMTPAIGNIADAADALLYTLEGEFGSAALSAASIIPFAGQLVAAKRAAKIVTKSPKKSRYLENLYSDDKRVSKVLEIDGKEVGYISGQRTHKGISVDGIHVDEEYRRLGFGTDLYKSLQDETSEWVYSHGWQQNPKTAGKVWDSLVKSGAAEMIPEGQQPIYYLKKAGINLKELLK